MAKNGNNTELPRVIKKYDEGWGRMMIEIWRNRIKMFHAVRTGQLHSSVDGGLSSINGIDAEFRFRFVDYGIYVENGVGNGYKRGNDGHLDFLDTGIKSGINLREKFGYSRGRRAGSAENAYSTMGMMREKRPWFTPSWWYSRKVIAEQMVDLIGDSYVGMFSSLDE